MSTRRPRTDPSGDYEELRKQGLSLDLTRGKPSPEQLDLSLPMLQLPGSVFGSRDGVDVRNYGGLDGLVELREIFAGPLQVPLGQLMAAGNSSLELMHDWVVQAMLDVIPGGTRRWADEPTVRFVCPVPGYDRHFALAERFGIELIPVDLGPDGPDMDQVESIVTDPTVKGMWCIPKYSNPTGTTYSADVVARLARMSTGASDFRLFWDNAYAVHHLTDTPPQLADVLDLAAKAGHPDRPLVFASTSKVTFAGAGVGFFGGSDANVTFWRDRIAKRTIGPDKINHLRHAIFLRDEPGLRAHMAAHRRLIAPKFQAVDRILGDELADSDATWTRPDGGYFITLYAPTRTAAEVVRLAAEAGVALTPAGATHPYGNDPDDSVIRIAPTFPSLADVEAATRAVAVCVRLSEAAR